MKILKSKESPEIAPEFFRVEASQYYNRVLPIVDGALKYSLYEDGTNIEDLEKWYDLDLSEHELVRVKLIIDN
jgi:hypothetical protein